MSSQIESQIVKAEEQLRLIILQSDVSTLDELLAPELIFMNQLGQVVIKQDDLEAQQSGTLRVIILCLLLVHF